MERPLKAARHVLGLGDGRASGARKGIRLRHSGLRAIKALPSITPLRPSGIRLPATAVRVVTAPAAELPGALAAELPATSAVPVLAPLAVMGPALRTVPAAPVAADIRPAAAREALAEGTPAAVTGRSLEAARHPHRLPLAHSYGEVVTDKVAASP